jgi:putative transposase
MPRIARVVVPGLPHHITQRGNRRQTAFFSEDDKALYIEILSIQSKKAGVRVWAYCLMNNHVHFVAVPEYQTSFAEGFGNTHKKYSRTVNFREGWRGYLWQGRFFSVPLS